MSLRKDGPRCALPRTLIDTFSRANASDEMLEWCLKAAAVPDGRTSFEIALIKGPKWPKVIARKHKGHAMQSMSAKDAKYGFGRLIDLARSEPVTVEKHGRPVVVVLAVEEYKRLCDAANGVEHGSDEVGTKPAEKPGRTDKV